MYKIDFTKKATNQSINGLIEYIKKNDINDEMYLDIAFLFTTDCTNVTKKFLQKLAHFFIKCSKSPILVVEILEVLKDDKDALEIYGSYFREYEGVEEMFGIKCTGEIEMEKYKKEISAPVKEKKERVYNKKGKKNKTRLNAKKEAQEKHRKNILQREKKKKEYARTEKLIKKFSTT